MATNNANLLWQHPTGDPVTVNCIHFEPQIGWTNIQVPTKIEITQQHDHDRVGVVDVPCVHLDPKITYGTMSVPNSFNLIPQHPAGDSSPVPAPCAHPLTPARVDVGRHIVFFTDDAKYQTMAIDLVDQLQTRLHVRTVGSTARPLLFFFREAVNGDPDDATDPFWSHYDPALHAIQVTRSPSPIDYGRVQRTLAHELGHAIVGQSCVQIPNESDPHSMKNPSHPGEAMSEGWAHFVRACLFRNNRSTPSGSFFVPDYEKRDTTVPKTRDIEYNILCVLWDLYDIAGSRFQGGMGLLVPDDDPAKSAATAFSFEELFGLFSPSLDTLPAGPVIWDIDNYLSRLKATYPDRASSVDGVRTVHLE